MSDLHINQIQNKIYQNFDSFFEVFKNWKTEKYKLVFTNGCFDILHRGHIDYLVQAAEMGDKLIIGLNSDYSVKILKGEDRPIVDEQSRAIMLAAFQFVDVVILFNEETPYELIKKIQPDVLVKGKDYEVEEIAGHDVVLARGGSVETIELTPGYSTSDLIQKIKNQV